MDTTSFCDYGTYFQAHAFSSGLHIWSTRFPYWIFEENIRNQLKNFEVFLKTALCGRHRENSQLSRLDAHALSLVGSFLDVAVPHYFFQALANLNIIVFHPYNLPESARFHLSEDEL